MGVTNFPNGVKAGNVTISGSTIVPDGGGTAVISDTAGHVVAHGSWAGTAAGTVATGLTGTVTRVVASLRTISTAVGEPFTVAAKPNGTGGSVDFTVYAFGGTAADLAAGTVDWVAFGTAV